MLVHPIQSDYSLDFSDPYVLLNPVADMAQDPQHESASMSLQEIEDYIVACLHGTAEKNQPSTPPFSANSLSSRSPSPSLMTPVDPISPITAHDPSHDFRPFEKSSSFLRAETVASPACGLPRRLTPKQQNRLYPQPRPLSSTFETETYDADRSLLDDWLSASGPGQMNYDHAKPDVFALEDHHISSTPSLQSSSNPSSPPVDFDDLFSDSSDGESNFSALPSSEFDVSELDTASTLSPSNLPPRPLNRRETTPPAATHPFTQTRLSALDSVSSSADARLWSPFGVHSMSGTVTSGHPLSSFAPVAADRELGYSYSRHQKSSSTPCMNPADITSPVTAVFNTQPVSSPRAMPAYLPPVSPTPRPKKPAKKRGLRHEIMGISKAEPAEQLTDMLDPARDLALIQSMLGVPTKPAQQNVSQQQASLQHLQSVKPFQNMGSPGGAAVASKLCTPSDQDLMSHSHGVLLSPVNLSNNRTLLTKPPSTPERSIKKLPSKKRKPVDQTSDAASSPRTPRKTPKQMPTAFGLSFVNYTPADAVTLSSAVAPSGSGKRKGRDSDSDDDSRQYKRALS